MTRIALVRIVFNIKSKSMVNNFGGLSHGPPTASSQPRFFSRTRCEEHDARRDPTPHDMRRFAIAALSGFQEHHALRSLLTSHLHWNEVEEHHVRTTCVQTTCTQYAASARAEHATFFSCLSTAKEEIEEGWEDRNRLCRQLILCRKVQWNGF